MAQIDKLIDTAELERLLQALGNDVAQGYKATLESDDHIATDRLFKSVSAIEDVMGTTYEVKLNLEDYWKYLEYGTRPHWPPRSAILKWITAKKIVPYPDKRGRIPSPQQLAFLICRKISRFGTKGTHGLKRTVDAVLPAYKQLLKEALGRMYGNYIQQIAQFPAR